MLLLSLTVITQGQSTFYFNGLQLSNFEKLHRVLMAAV